MAAFASDQWSTNYEKCEQYGQRLMETINERNRLQRIGSNHSKVSAEVRIGLRNYGQDVERLRKSLKQDMKSEKFLHREGERRSGLIDHLLAREKILTNAFKKDVTYSSPDRESLLPNSTSGFAEDYWGRQPEESNENFSVDTIREQQQQMIEAQDEGLDILASVIARQKQMGQTISNELDEHNELLDDITVHTVRADQRIDATTRRVKNVSKKAKDGWYYVVIVILLIAIVVVAVVPK